MNGNLCIEYVYLHELPEQSDSLKCFRLSRYFSLLGSKADNNKTFGYLLHIVNLSGTFTVKWGSLCTDSWINHTFLEAWKHGLAMLVIRILVCSLRSLENWWSSLTK